MENAIVVSNSPALMPVLGIDVALARYQAVKEFVSAILVEGVDFGPIPGTDDKPTLLKPGAEKFITFFGLSASFEVVKSAEEWNADEPFFYFHYKAKLHRLSDGIAVGEGEGSANSRESRYRWRWVEENDVPRHLDLSTLTVRTSSVSEFAFAIEKAETTGKYGKPAAHWQTWRDAIANGTARQVMRKTKNGESQAWEMGGALYRVPNPDIESQVNTIQKMGQKRALIAAVLVSCNASDYFTQDMEDVDYGVASYSPATRPADENTIEGEFTSVATVLRNQQAAKSTQNASKNADIANGYMNPVGLRDYLAKTAQDMEGRQGWDAIPDAKQYGPLAGKLDGLCGDEDLRHEFINFVWGVTSIRECGVTQIWAMNFWLGQRPEQAPHEINGVLSALGLIEAPMLP
jgi:hypothetical protein